MNLKNNRNLFSNFIALGIIQGTNFLLPLLVMPFVIKKIGADGFGVVAVAQVVMIYLSTIADYGFNLTATRDIALNRGDSKQVSKIFFTVLAAKFVVTALAFLLLLILIAVVPAFHSHFALYILGFSYVIGQSFLVSWFFQGMEKMQYITISTLVARSIFVVLVFLFIQQKDDKSLFLLFLGTGNIIAGLFSVYLAIYLFKLKYVRPLWADIIHELKDGWQVTVSNLSINTYLYTNIFVLRLFTSDLVVGYYSVAERIFFAVRQLLGIFSQAVYPHICQLILQQQARLRAFFKEIYLPFTLLVLVGCTVTFIWSADIVQLFLGNKAGTAVLLLKTLSFVPVIVSLNIPAYLLLLAHNEKKSYFKILTMGTVVNLVANISLVNLWGATGTAISIIITELFITIGLNIELWKKKFLTLVKPDVL